MASTSGAPPSQEFTVRVQKSSQKVYGIMKFNPNNKVDFTKCNGAKIERENNVKDYKAAHNLDTMPKFGAGSEFGRDQKEEARRKKYGYYMKSYNVEDQPWKLKLGTGKATRNFKGSKEGGILDNASYYIFTQCPDGAFEAFPIDEWHNFNPVISYKHLSAEEAEEQYSKREQILNYHTIMVQKRIKDDQDVSTADDNEDKKAKNKKKGKDFLLTDMDEWAQMSDESGADSDTEVTKSLKGQKKKKLSKKSGKKHNSDDEAIEESDDADEGREVDYMTDTDSEDEDPFADKDREETDKYKEKGVEDEEALQKLIESDEEEEVTKKENEEDNPEENEKEKKKDGSDSESSSSSDSDSDPEKESNFASALFMPIKGSHTQHIKKLLSRHKTKEKDEKDTGEKKDKKNKKDKDKSKKTLKRKGSFSSEGSSNSRSPTPTVTAAEAAIAAAKKTQETPASKKPKLESTMNTGIEGLSEDTVRRYLTRKPMTTKDLLQKFKKEGLPKEKLVTTIAEILKKINPEKNKIKDKLYLSIKQ